MPREEQTRKLSQDALYRVAVRWDHYLCTEGDKPHSKYVNGNSEGMGRVCV